MTARFPLFLIALSILACSALPAAAQDNARFAGAMEKELQRQGIVPAPGFNAALRQGQQELAEGNHIVAAQRLGEAYRLEAGHPLPPFLIALACVGMRQYDRAAEFLRFALQLWPQLGKAGPHIPSFLGSREAHAKLVKALEDDLFSRKPGSAEASRALLLAGTFQAFGGDAARAFTYLAAVPEGAPEHVAAALLLKSVPEPAPPPDPAKRKDLVTRANRLFVEGRYVEAAHVFAAAIVENPDDPLAYFEMGQALFAGGYFRHAARALALGLEKRPDWPKADMNRVDFYPAAHRRQYEEQVGRLRNWVAEHPHDGAARFLLGYELYFSARRPTAKAHFEAAVQNGWAQAADPFLAHLVGRAPAIPGKTDTPPAPPTPVPGDGVVEGRRLLAAGDFDGATAVFTAAIGEPQHAAEALAGLAAVWFARGDFGKSGHWLRMAFRADPNRLQDVAWAAALGQGGLFEKRLEEARKQSRALDARRRQGATLSETDREVWFVCGYGLYRLGKLDEARGRFQEIILEWEDQDAVAVHFFRVIDRQLQQKREKGD